MSKKTASMCALFVWISSQPLFAQELSKETLCQTLAKAARQYYEGFRKTELDHPDWTREYIAESMRNFVYQQFKKKLEEDSSPTSSSLYDVLRLWQERGVKDYVTNPNLSPITYERSAYSRCVGQSGD